MTIRKLLIILALLPLFAVAQNKAEESKYLAGAVPVNAQGIVYFSHDYECPGKTKAEVYDLLKAYVEQNIVKGENALPQCKLVEANAADGLLAARVEETLYFKKKAWVTHSTRFFYELIYNVKDGGFSVEMRKLHYLYDEFQTPNGEPQAMTAEDWITDSEALNKKGTLIKRTRNFRIGTIDRKDEIFRESAKAAGAKFKTKLVEVEE